MKFVATVKAIGNALMVEAPRWVKVTDGEYQVELRDASELSRSDRQNAMMWSIINAICMKIDGNTRDNYNLYCQILEMAGTPYWDARVDDSALDSARKLLKHVMVVDQHIEEGKLIDYCWVFKGISEMTKKEASQLIDAVKFYAGEAGVDVDEDKWRQLYEWVR